MPNGEKKKGLAKLVYPEATEEDQRLYSNSVFVNHTPWDFALHFYHIVPPVAARTVPPMAARHQSSGEIEIKANKVAVVGLPVTLMRGLIQALQSNLERYEKQYGKIEIPKEEAQK